MLKQKNGVKKLRNSATGELAAPEYLIPKESTEPDIKFSSSLHPNSYGYALLLYVLTTLSCNISYLHDLELNSE
jgi:hypothetical protein